MKNRSRFLANSFMGVLLTGMLFPGFGCKSVRPSADGPAAQINDSHNSGNALDWAGIYKGLVPRTDGTGMRSMLELYSDNTYLLRYYDKGDSIPVTKKGIFSWSKKGSVIILDGLSRSLYFRVAENELDLLNEQGNPIKGTFSGFYRFTKTEQDGIGEKYWKLTRLGGRLITFSGGKEPHMILKPVDSTVKGFAGCNGFGARVELLPGKRIRFSQISATMMACQDLALEQSFLQVLAKADNYTQHGDTLYLNRARMAPLAQFVAVYLQ